MTLDAERLQTLNRVSQTHWISAPRNPGLYIVDNKTLTETALLAQSAQIPDWGIIATSTNLVKTSHMLRWEIGVSGLYCLV